MSAPAFVHHNIVLDDGSQTLPCEPVLADTAAAAGALALAQRLCPTGAKRAPRVVDLGCLDGGYAVMFARAGYDVLGIDARASNIQRCQGVADALELPNLRFEVDDARNLADHGPFDVSCCFGLLYHLDEPVRYLRTLAAQTRKLLIIHGHHAPLDQRSPAIGTYRLSGLTDHEGVQGRWYLEPKFADDAEMESSSLSSWRNPRSFWLTKPELLRVLRDAGFSQVREEFDSAPDSFGGFSAIKGQP